MKRFDFSGSVFGPRTNPSCQVCGGGTAHRCCCGSRRSGQNYSGRNAVLWHKSFISKLAANSEAAACCVVFLNMFDRRTAVQFGSSRTERRGCYKRFPLCWDQISLHLKHLRFPPDLKRVAFANAACLQQNAGPGRVHDLIGLLQ